MRKIKLSIGDLVRLRDPMDTDRQIGVVVGISPKPAHLVSHGTTIVIQVYWPALGVTDWEYDFFLSKVKTDLTDEEI